MKLSLLTAIALPLVAATATEGDLSWGTDKSFGAVLAAADIAVSGHTDDQPSYCYMPPPNQKCYRDGYPKCCNKTKGNCPLNKAPGCECDGDCAEEVSCLYPNDACGSDEFCMIQEGACRQRSATVSGSCTDMPKMCVANFDPVCGCDGETYANSCQAAGAGVNVEHKGECRNDNKRPEPTTCSWPNGEECGNNEFCLINTGDCRKRTASINGVCSAMSPACGADYSPVCGCDGITYSNSCTARSAGMNIVHEGKCRGQTCRYPNDDDCRDDEFCKVETGDCRKRSTTISGKCTEKPEMCTLDYNPVCGCDGETYGNACQADGYGVSIVSEGECNTRTRPGSSYCTWSPDYDCYEEGWPKCCGDDDQPCPDSQPRCDKGAPGWDYCAWEPDYDCYSNGHPKCCQRFQGTNCMTDKPYCDNPTENSEDGFKVKFLRSN